MHNRTTLRVCCSTTRIPRLNSKVLRTIKRTMSPAAVNIGPAGHPAVIVKAEATTNIAPVTQSNPEHEEYQYLDLTREILENGEHRPDRLVGEKASKRTSVNPDQNRHRDPLDLRASTIALLSHSPLGNFVFATCARPPTTDNETRLSSRCYRRALVVYLR